MMTVSNLPRRKNGLAPARFHSVIEALESRLVLSVTIPAMMGGGNFTNGSTDATTVQKFQALNTVGAGALRMNLYPQFYWDSGAQAPKVTNQDAQVLLAYQHGVTPMILFEHYGTDGQPGGYSKWYSIGQAYASRFSPNSAWLSGQGIHNWGISVFSAFNEPDADHTLNTAQYATALEGLADGVHVVNSALKVIPGGFMRENAYSNSTLYGYGTAIAPLLNNGKLDGIDLHTYNDIQYAPIVKTDGTVTFSFSPQSDFDSVKLASGITRDINFYSTEFNFKKDASQGITEDLAAKRLLTVIWANLGVVKNDGTAATQLAFPWNIFTVDSGTSFYGMASQLSPWIPTQRGGVLAMVTDLTQGLSFTALDPKGAGVFNLEGENREMWVWQNYTNWSNLAGTSHTINGIPATATRLEVYDYAGLKQTITLAGQSSYSFTGLNARQTYMFLAVSEAKNLAPTHDATVRGGAFSSTNYGQDAALWLKDDNDARYDRQFHLQFDTKAYSEITQAKLVLTPTARSANPSLLAIRVRLQNDVGDNWTENTITWNTRSLGLGLSAPLPGASLVVNQPVEVDVLALLRQTLNTNSIASFQIDLTNGAGGEFVTFASGEHATSLYRPQLRVVGVPSTPRLNEDFSDGNMNGWTVVDQGDIGGPSAWSVVNGKLKQSTNIYSSGSQSAAGRKGTFAFWNAPSAFSWSNYRLDLQIHSTDDDGVGVMLYYKDANNYYRFEMDKQRGYRRLIAMSNGVATILAEDAFAYNINQIYAFSGSVVNGVINISLGGQPVFSNIQGVATLTSGTIAMYSWGNDGSYYDNMQITAL